MCLSTTRLFVLHNTIARQKIRLSTKALKETWSCVNAACNEAPRAAPGALASYIYIYTRVRKYRVDVGIMSQMVLWVHPIITGYQKTSVFQRKGVNQAYVVLRVVMVR